jgi:hypothetical protein
MMETRITFLPACHHQNLGCHYPSVYSVSTHHCPNLSKSLLCWLHDYPQNNKIGLVIFFACVAFDPMQRHRLTSPMMHFQSINNLFSSGSNASAQCSAVWLRLPLFLNLVCSRLLIALCHGHKPFDFPRWRRDEWCPLSTLNLPVDGM